MVTVTEATVDWGHIPNSQKCHSSHGEVQALPSSGNSSGAQSMWREYHQHPLQAGLMLPGIKPTLKQYFLHTASASRAVMGDLMISSLLSKA